jgi:hypothetical protein
VQRAEALFCDTALFHLRLNDGPTQIRDVVLNGETHHYLIESFVVSSCSPHLHPNLHLVHWLILLSTDGLKRHRLMADRREEQRANMYRT